MDEVTRVQLNRNVAALADGERSAFDPVYRALWPLLVRFIASLSGDRMIAEDIAQQSLLKIFSKVSTFDRSRDALAWSMAIAANEYRSYRRKVNRHEVELDDSVLAGLADPDTPEAAAMRDDLCTAARTVLGKLRPQDLETVIAALYDGRRPPLAAAAFRKRLQRAIAATRLLWKKHYGDGTP